MKNRAFFFQGDSLLLPRDFTVNMIEEGIPVNLSCEFKDVDLFVIPSLKDPSSAEDTSFDVCGVSIPAEAVLPDYWKRIPVRQIFTMFSAEPAAIVITDIIRASHIAQWRRESCFCGTCGTKNTDVTGQTQRLCPNCGRIEFPRICPAVITAITDNENRLLLAHNKKFRTGVYSHISGFNEAGESLEETVAREVMEEVSVIVTDIKYIKSQPWPFPNSLMLGFKASYKSGTLKPDGEEIEDVKWFTKDNLPELPGEGSLSRYLINCWLDDTLSVK